MLQYLQINYVNYCYLLNLEENYGRTKRDAHQQHIDESINHRILGIVCHLITVLFVLYRNEH